MFRYGFLFVLIGFAKNLTAQAYKDSVKAQFIRYTNLLIQKEFAKSVEYMNPEIFKIFPKEQMLTIIEKTYNNPLMTFNIEDPVIISTGNEKKVNAHHFVKLRYSNYLTLHYNKDNGRTPDTAAIKSVLQKQFGQQNVQYNAAADSYRVFSIKEVIANSADLRNWTFIVVEERQKPLLEKFIPREVLEN